MDVINYTLKDITPTIQNFQKLRQSTGWSTLSDKAVANGLTNTLFSVTAFHQSDVIGMGRVMGDGHIYFYIQDVIVLPEYQKR